MPKIIKVLNSFHSWLLAQEGSIPDTDKPVPLSKQWAYQINAYASRNSNSYINNVHHLFQHSVSPSPGIRSTPVTIDITGNQEIFIRVNIPKGCWFRYDSGASANPTPGDLRKVFKLKNTSGDTVTCFGFEKRTLESANNSNFHYIDHMSGKVQINTMNGDDNYVTASNTTNGKFDLKNYVGAGADGPQTINVNLFMHAKIDTANHDQSFLRMYVNGILQTEIVGADCHSHTNMTLGSIVIDDTDVVPHPDGINPNQFGLSVGELVVSDYKNFSLRAMTVVPTQLSDGNQFSGTVSSLFSMYQDKNFLTSPNIVSTVAEFHVNRTDAANVGGGGGIGLIEGVHKIRAIDTLVGTRFVDPTTPQVRFGVSMTDNTSTPVIPQQEIIEQANWDSNYYHVRDLGVAQVDLPISKLAEIKGRIEILGV